MSLLDNEFIRKPASPVAVEPDHSRAWNPEQRQFTALVESVKFRGLLAAIGAEVHVFLPHFGTGVDVEFSAWVPCRDTGQPIRLRKQVYLDPLMPEKDVKICIKRAFFDMMCHEVDESLGFNGVFEDPHKDDFYK